MFQHSARIRRLLWAVFAVALVLGGWQRAAAVERLPPDFDELIYLPAAFHYRQLAGEGSWAQLAGYRENLEHPPLVKLMFAGTLAATDAPVPDWKQVQVGRPTPEGAVPAFAATRWLSWAFGMGQLVAVGLVHPAGALGLAVSSYHAKYTAQAYLEAVPGLFALLAVLLFERAFRRRSEEERRRPVRVGWLLGSAVLLGLATAGKYPYGLVVSLALAPFVLLWGRGHLRWLAAFAAVAVVAFFLADPFLWPQPLARLGESVGFHLDYSQSEHVKKSALPWWQPVYWLTRSEPYKWHAGLFFTPLADWTLLPLALAGLGRALRVRPVFASWMILGMIFLFLWPTKWPQYILLVLPAIAVCAGIGVESLLIRFLRPWRWSSAPDPQD
ncbi:MAG: hypothetical protein M3Y59_21595 [Myxococcota bacterium]|nr:hypothetical protein [Myxococcota bacterium]